MYKLLVVDDDPWMCDYLTTCMDWEAMGVDSVYTAGGGHAALELVKERQVDIIVSDVHMDGKDGIELLKEVQALKRGIKVLLISGYDRYDYVRGGFKHGAVDYLFKPVDAATLAEGVRAAIQAIRLDRAEAEEARRISTQLAEGQAMRLEKQLAAALAGDETALAALPPWAQGKPGDGPLFVWAAAPPKGGPPWPGTLARDAAAALAPAFAALCFVDGDRLVGLARGEGDGQALADLLRHPADGGPLPLGSVGVSRPGAGGAALQEAYAEAQQALWLSFYGAGPGDYFAEEKGPAQETLFGSHKAGQLRNMVDAASWQDARRLVDEVLDKARRKRLPRTALQVVALRLFDALSPGGDPSTLRFETFEDLAALRAFLHGLLESAGAGGPQSDAKKRHRVIEQATALLEADLVRPLSLEKMAGQLYVHPAYLSRLFKEVQGVTYTQYLMRRRIERAKALLKAGNLRVYKVGQAVGYDNMKYFHKVFKEHTGVTPGEYREHVEGDGRDVPQAPE